MSGSDTDVEVHSSQSMTELSLHDAVEWRQPVWAPAVSRALAMATEELPSESHVLELGFGSGAMACYMAARAGWRVTGFEANRATTLAATKRAEARGLADRVTFQTCAHADTLSLTGQYDGLFLKSFLFHIADRPTYLTWLSWIGSVLRPGGKLMLCENGRGGPVDRLYRRMNRRCYWRNNVLYDSWVEAQLRERFDVVGIDYFGRYAHWFSRIPIARTLAAASERILVPPDADSCFVASVVARNP